MGLSKKYVGDGYPLCEDLPTKHFLKKGAKYRLTSNGQPELQVDPESWGNPNFLGSGTADRMSADPNGQLYMKLCQSEQGVCQYPVMVELDIDLDCMGSECNIETIRTIEVETGVFYEYIRTPCVEKAFFEGGLKVVPYDYLMGPLWAGTAEEESGFIMCANPYLAVANTACCSSTPFNSDSYNAFAKGQIYWGERLSYATAEARCAQAQHHGHCPLPHMSAFCNNQNPVPVTEGCTTIYYNHNQAMVNGASRQSHFWTSDPCQIQAKINLRSGKVGLVHSTSQDDSMLALHVQPGTKTMFRVDWGTSTLADVAAAVSASSSCADLEADTASICAVSIMDEVVFTDIHTPSSIEDVLLKLSIGAFHPSATAPPGTSVLSSSIGDVIVHYIQSNGMYSIDTVFEVVDEFGRTQLRKNVESTVTIDGTGLAFRNPVHVTSLVDPEPRDMAYEVDAALDQVFYHQNVAPFLAYRFAQRFGISNPSAQYVETVAAAFKSGIYSPVIGATIGSGEYGDMSAFVAAILLEDESRDISRDNDPNHGALGEPLIRLIKLMRALEFEAPPHHRLISFLFPSAIGQMVRYG